MNTPLDLAIVTGFGDKGITDLKTELDRSLQPASSHIIPSAPWYRALHEPEDVIADAAAAVDALIPKRQPPNLLLIGHSYGALIALIVACRRRLRGILKLVLLDGPLRPDVEVQPAKTAHRLFYKHYREREKLAKECEEALKILPSDNILAMGTTKDRIVPPAAKTLPSNSLQVRLRSADTAASYEPVMKGGTNILMDMPEMAGHGLTKAKAELYGKIIKNML